MVNLNEQISLEQYKKAYRTYKNKMNKNFLLYHAIVYLFFNSFFILFNLLFTIKYANFIWFVWPLLIWGTFLILHYIFYISSKDRICKFEAYIEYIARQVTPEE